MKVAFSALSVPKQGAVAAVVLAERKLSPSAAKLDEMTDGALTRAMAASRFKGDKGQILDVLVPPQVENSRILLVGAGKSEELKDVDVENLGGTIVSHMNGTGESEAAVLWDGLGGGKASPGNAAARCAFGALLGSYRFDRYKTKQKDEQKPSLTKLTVMSEDHSAAKRAYQRLEHVAQGVFVTRDLVSEPANVIYPETLAAEAKQLEKDGVKVQVLGVREMRRLGMNALLGVGQGSAHEPRLLVLRWDGAAKAKDKRPIAFVGKGVTFDTGGISIKPAAGMEDMKWDMGGAGVVIGVMRALAARKAKVNAVGVCGLVENMPSGTAQRPGDIVTSMSGQTIEVLNTDAEGRLVLADALCYAQDKFKPKAIVDLATLTGAIIVSLGHVYGGLFSTDEQLAERLGKAGEAVGEPLWRMPLREDYDKAIDSDAADVKNISGNRAAGAITAAQFLKRFIQDGVPWAHLDIAGVTWSTKDKPTVPKGATAFGVRLLDRLVADHYEN